MKQLTAFSLAIHEPGRGAKNLKQISVEVAARYYAGILFGFRWLSSRSVSSAIIQCW